MWIFPYSLMQSYLTFWLSKQQIKWPPHQGSNVPWRWRWFCLIKVFYARLLQRQNKTGLFSLSPLLLLKLQEANTFPSVSLGWAHPLSLDCFLPRLLRKDSFFHVCFLYMFLFPHAFLYIKFSLCLLSEASISQLLLSGWLFISELMVEWAFIVLLLLRFLPNSFLT